MIESYFRQKVQTIADDCLPPTLTKADWEADRPKRRREFMEMMGLWPLPAKSPLHARITGTVNGDGFIVEKLVFESMPGLFVTGNLYRPNTTGPHPSILYVCGHGNVVEKGISYGSKVSYQYHPAWFAAHGYVCLALDTLQLGEIPGEHHGTYRLKQWWWQSHSYTPGGIELWNAIRAIDYLETRPEVNRTKIGVTGRSGGGATSWWIMAADDRPVCAAPIAGIVDLQSHVCEGQTENHLKKGVIAGHCDCMFMVNSYRWDFPLVAAMAAPRPILLGNSDQDDIFPVAGYRRLAKKVWRVYDVYGVKDRFELLETKGPHQDSPELRIGINRFFNRHLKGDTTTRVVDDLPPKLTPQQLKVLTEVPGEAINPTMPRSRYRSVPFDGRAVDSWGAQPSPGESIREKLETTILGSWRQRPKGDHTVRSNPDGSMTIPTEPGISVTLRVKTPVASPSRIRLTIADDVTWPSADSGAAGPQPLDLILHVRGTGPGRWAEPGSTRETHIRRRFPLVGDTLEAGQVRDILAVVQALPRILPDLNGRPPVELRGEHSFAGLALYAAILDANPKADSPGALATGISSLTLINPPASFRDDASPQFLGAANLLDHPAAAAIASKLRPVMIEKTNPKMWASAIEFAKKDRSCRLTVTAE